MPQSTPAVSVLSPYSCVLCCVVMCCVVLCCVVLWHTRGASAAAAPAPVPPVAVPTTAPPLAAGTAPSTGAIDGVYSVRTLRVLRPAQAPTQPPASVTLTCVASASGVVMVFRGTPARPAGHGVGAAAAAGVGAGVGTGAGVGAATSAASNTPSPSNSTSTTTATTATPSTAAASAPSAAAPPAQPTKAAPSPRRATAGASGSGGGAGGGGGAGARGTKSTSSPRRKPLHRVLRGLLNKLTVDNAARVIPQICALSVANEGWCPRHPVVFVYRRYKHLLTLRSFLFIFAADLRTFATVVHNRALQMCHTDSATCRMYATLCTELAAHLPCFVTPDNSVTSFRALLARIYTTLPLDPAPPGGDDDVTPAAADGAFGFPFVPSSPPAPPLHITASMTAVVGGRSFLVRCVTLLAHLVLHHLVSTSVVHMVMSRLLDGRPVPDDRIEAACELLSLVGHVLDATPVSRASLDEYMEVLVATAPSPSTRIRERVAEVAARRQHNWAVVKPPPGSR